MQEGITEVLVKPKSLADQLDLETRLGKPAEIKTDSGSPKFGDETGSPKFGSGAEEESKEAKIP